MIFYELLIGYYNAERSIANKTDYSGMRGLLLLISFLFCFSAFSFGENSFRFQNITTKEGLSQNTVSCFKQDSRGFLWIGTLNGLDRYDGTEFMVFLPKYGNSLSLSDNRIKSIHEDGFGHIWIQTNIDNINCYDTRLERFVDFHPFSTNHTDIYVSKRGDVWLWGSKNGCLQVVNKANKPVSTHFGKDLLGSDVVNFVFEGNDGVIWIGTDRKLFSYQDNVLKVRSENSDFHSVVEAGDKLYFFTGSHKIIIFDKGKIGQINEVRVNVGDEKSRLNHVALLSKNTILITSKAETYLFNTESLKVGPANSLFAGKTLKNAFTYFDNKDNLWIYNNSGSLWQYNKLLNSFSELPLIPPSVLSFIDLERYSIFEDSRGIVWITTYGNGLFTLNRNTGGLNHFKHEKNGASRLPTNFLLSVTEDRSGEIWVGTEYAGISKISVTPKNNKVFYPEGNETGKDDKAIRLIHEDANENIWLGTKTGHLYVYGTDYKLIEKNVIDGGMPYAFAGDTAGNSWVGTKGKGLLIFRQGQYDRFDAYTASALDTRSIPDNNIYAICKDSKGRMWIGTFGSGLLLAERRGDRLSFRRFPEISKQQSRIRTIQQDHEGFIWVGGNNGVTVFNPDELMEDDHQFLSFNFDGKNAKSLSNNEVKIVTVDSRGRVWLGTSGGGINLVMREERMEDTWFKHFTSEAGLVNNIVQGIEEDDAGHLWISTESGISKFDTRSSRFENYYFSDSWEGNLFFESASFKRKNGDLLFGSHNGMYIVKPGDLTGTDLGPPVVLTRLSVNGNTVSPGDGASPLTESITVTRKISLRYDQNSFDIQFATLHFRDPVSNSFTYFLEGYEKTWNPVTRHRVATYRNVGLGTYTFRVKGRNSFGVWNEAETTLEIRVVPPFWLSSRAILFYSVVLLLIGWIAVRVTMKINKLNTAVKVEQQLTEYKLLFFTNVSHEFRTPLTIIRGAIESLNSQQNIPERAQKLLGFLDKSSLRLLMLITQLLDFRQLQNSQPTLSFAQTDVVGFFKDIASTFEDLAEKKKIAFGFKANRPSWNMLLDQNKMEQVAYNLFSNAFKFTPENGKIDIELTINEQNDLFSLKVSDTGTGIPKEKRGLLFVMFKQINPSATGTGIGLHLVSEIVKVHKGEIVYRDSESGGACFVVNIPLSVKINESDVRAGDEEKTNRAFEWPSPEEPGLVKEEGLPALKDYKLLIIEDDPEIGGFLQLQLSEYFQVVTAQNGLTGLQKGTDEQPDLIICDVMMPEMDGYEVTHRLKSAFETCHIPVIMLTALSSIEHQLRGIVSGADSYITKPFSIKYLLTRIVKLIEQRDRLQQKFVKDPGLLQMPVFSVDKDNEFMKKIHETIELNIESADFSIDTFASTIGMGRTAFFKKIKGLTGFTPNGYRRVIRLKKAAELLTTTNLNVSEVAYKVGINNPFYFSKCFKEQFGVTPSEFAKKGNEEM